MTRLPGCVSTRAMADPVFDRLEATIRARRDAPADTAMASATASRADSASIAKLASRASIAAFSLLAAFASEARADDELKLDWSGRIQSDLRLRVEDRGIGDFYNRIELPVGVERNQNLFNLQLKSTFGRFKGVASMDFVLNGVPGKLDSLSDLSTYEKVQPYRFEPQALYIEAKDLIVKGLDFRVGHQIVSWGVADQFNPTNNLNADDLRDPLLFGRQQANFMVKLDYW